MKIYVYGCSTCGVNSIYTRAAKRYAQENSLTLEIKNSKYNETHRIEHAYYLASANISLDSYQPIVIEGDNTVKLSEWLSLFQS